MGKQMKAAVFTGVGQFDCRELPVPALGPHDVLIRNRACGVCGTDVHIFHGEPGSASVTPPVVLGHEYAGVVEAVGAAVTSVSPDDHVTVDPNIYCGQCTYCRNGQKHMCTSMQAIGVTRDGGFAQYSVAPENQTFLLGQEVTFAEGAMTEPVACCLHGIDLAGIRAGDIVCIVGGGAIGLMMVQLAQISGAAAVVLSEPNEARRSAGFAVGADMVLDPTEPDYLESFRLMTESDGADVVIECVGSLPAVNSAFACAKKGATIVLFSVPQPEAKFELPLFELYQKELTIRGSFVNPDTHDRAVALINAGKLDFDPIITHTYGLEAIEDAINMQISSDSIKVIVEP